MVATTDNKMSNSMAKKDKESKSAAAGKSAAKTAAKSAAKTAAGRTVDSTTGRVGDGNPQLKTTLQQIEKQFGEGAIMALGSRADRAIDGIPTGSLSLDMALGGQGIPRGRIIEVFGPESSGKTTLALHVVAEAQKQGGIAAIIDAEHAFDPELGQEAGRRAGDAAGQPADVGEEAMQITEMLVKSNAVDVIIIDSVAALVPRQELEGEIGDSHVGLQARLMSQSMRKLTGAIAKSKTAVIFINQIREKIGVMFGSPETTPGGRALEVLLLVPHRRAADRAAEGWRRGGRPARAVQGGQEQGRPAVPRRRVRHDAHQRHQLRRRRARSGRGPEGRRSQRFVVQVRRHASGPGQGKGAMLPDRESRDHGRDQAERCWRPAATALKYRPFLMTKHKSESYPRGPLWKLEARRSNGIKSAIRSHLLRL